MRSSTGDAQLWASESLLAKDGCHDGLEHVDLLLVGRGRVPPVLAPEVPAVVKAGGLIANGDDADEGGEVRTYATP